MMGFNEFVSRSYFSTRLALRSDLSNRYRWFKGNEKKSRSEIQALQWMLLSKILLYAEKNVPYYQELFKKSGIHASEIRDRESFARLPLLKKADLQDNLEQLVASNKAKENLVLSGTGGSTGAPTHFYHDREYAQAALSLKWRNRAWTGWEPGESQIKIWGSAFDIKPREKFSGHIFNYLNNLLVLPAFEMSNTNLDHWLKQVRAKRPAIVEGYTNPLVAFARHAEQRNIRLNDLGVKAVINAAETLYEPQRHCLSKVFGCKVYNRYGGRELSDVAHECQAGTLHTCDDWVYVEIVDECGQPVGPGERGQIVLTGLFSEAMPFIRYAVEDVGILLAEDSQCSCGLPFGALANLEGRIQDLIVLPNGGFLAGEFFPHLFKDFDVRQFQVIQYTPSTLEVNIVPGPGLSEDHLAYLHNKVQKYLEKMNVSFKRVADIPVSPSGKFRSTISHVAGGQPNRDV